MAFFVMEGSLDKVDASIQRERKFQASFLMESIAFGLTDGIVCFLGIIVGVATATYDSRAVIIAAIVGGIADAMGNSIGFFVSQSTERAVQINAAEEGENHNIHSQKEVWMSGVFSFLSTILALVLLLWPFAFLGVFPATILSFVIGTILAFILGTCIGKLSKEPLLKSGIKYSLITVAGAVICYGIGELLHIYLY